MKFSVIAIFCLEVLFFCLQWFPAYYKINDPWVPRFHKSTPASSEEQQREELLQRSKIILSGEDAVNRFEAMREEQIKQLHISQQLSSMNGTATNSQFKKVILPSYNLKVYYQSLNQFFLDLNPSMSLYWAELEFRIPVFFRFLLMLPILIFPVFLLQKIRERAPRGSHETKFKLFKSCMRNNPKQALQLFKSDSSLQNLLIEHSFKLAHQWFLTLCTLEPREAVDFGCRLWRQNPENRKFRMELVSILLKLPSGLDLKFAPILEEYLKYNQDKKIAEHIWNTGLKNYPDPVLEPPIERLAKAVYEITCNEEVKEFLSMRT
jgi:hypothetical protein